MSTQDIYITLILSGCFLLLFAILEILYHYFKVDAEYTRKMSHIFSGILTIIFLVYFNHLWQGLLICFTFFILLALSMKYNFLKSINAVDRKTYGNLLYPLIVMFVFAFYIYAKEHFTLFGPRLYFYLPILVFALCDPAAAFAGRYYQKTRPHITGKTLVGSAAFFVLAFLISLPLLLYYNRGGLDVFTLIALALALALTTTLAEKWSTNGWDNFNISFTAVIVLFVFEKMAG